MHLFLLYPSVRFCILCYRPLLQFLFNVAWFLSMLASILTLLLSTIAIILPHSRVTLARQAYNKLIFACSKSHSVRKWFYRLQCVLDWRWSIFTFLHSLCMSIWKRFFCNKMYYYYFFFFIIFYFFFFWEISPYLAPLAMVYSKGSSHHYSNVSFQIHRFFSIVFYWKLGSRL